MSCDHHSTLMFPTVTVITFQCYGIGLCNVWPVTICYILHFLVTQIKRFGRHFHFLWLIFGNWIFWLLRNWVFCRLIYTTVLKIILHRESWEERRYWITISKLSTLSYRSISLIRVSPPFAWFQDDFVLNQIRQCEDERFQIQLRHQSLDDTYPTSAIEIAAWLTGKPSHLSCYLGSNKIVNIRTLLFLPSLY